MIKISIQYLNDVNWTDASGLDYAVSNNVDVWRIKISSNLQQIKPFLALMHPDEISRAERYYHIKDKNRFIIARGALRHILGKYLNRQPYSIEFETGQNKKPHIKNNTKLCYNISHSGDWILLAISNSEIGADVELINHSYSYKDVLPDNFSPAEIDFINQKLSAERFFLLWTRKEALTKATGKGLDNDLKLIPCLDGVHFADERIISAGTDWLVNTFKMDENYMASVASTMKFQDTRYRDIYF